MEIFKLFGSVFIKTDEAEKSLSSIEGKTFNFAKTVENVTEKANKFALVAGGAFAAVGGALFGLTVKTAETADEIDKMSERTGITRERLQELKYAAGQCGVEFGTVESAVKTLTKNMGKADDESKRMVDAFGDLGIGIKDANGNIKSSSDLFEESIMKLAGMQNQTERNILGAKIFGGAWNDMIPLINQGQDGIKALTDRSRELGLVMSEDTVKANVVFGDTLDDIKQSAGAVGVQLANKLLPYFQQLMDWVLENMPAIQEQMGKVFDKVADSIAWICDNFDRLKPILIAFVSVLATLNIINTIIKMVDFWNKATVAFTAVQKALNFVIEANPLLIWVTLAALAIGAIMLLWNNCEWFRDGLTAMWNTIVDLFTNVVFPIWQAFSGVIFGALESAFNSVSTYIESIKTIFTNIIDFIKNVFTGNWGDAWDNVKNIFGGIWDAISVMWKAPFNFMIGGLNAFIRGLNKIKLPDWVPGGLGGMGLNIDEIPELYKGTDYFKGGMALVGERGPELVEMPQGAKVNTHEQTQDKLNQGDIYITNITNLDGKEIARETKKIISKGQINKDRAQGGLAFV